MNTKRRSFTRFLSCLLALCLLLSIIPATAESPATPTDLGPVTEEVQESGEPEVSGEPEAAGEDEEAETTGDPGDPDGASGEEGLPSAEEAKETDPVEADPNETDPDEADPAETEPVETDPFLATLKAGARLYADKDCYRKQQVLAEAAVVLVVKTEENASEILYAYLDVEDQAVPGKAYARIADLTPLTEDETAAWQAAAHPEAVERRGLRLEPVVFGTEEEPEKTEETVIEDSEEGETCEEPAEVPAEVPEEEPGKDPEEDLSDKDESMKTAVSVEEIGEIDWATPTDLSALSGASNTDAGDLDGAPVVPQGDDLPAVRDQNPYNTCWAFAAIGAMEIYLVSKGYVEASQIDLSEYYLTYYTYHVFPDAKPGGEGDLVEDTAGNDGYLSIGGTNLLAIRVLENLIGTVAEETVPYESAPEIPAKFEPVAAQLTGAYLVNVSEEKEDIDRIKTLIQQHGAVGVSIYMPSSYNKIISVDGGMVAYDINNHALYGTTTRANHDILLVGWDDDFKKVKFFDGLQPSGNGAWKARNSWGAGWSGGDQGYFWISYYDQALKSNDATAYSAINNNTSDDAVPDFCYSYSKIPDNDDYERSSAWVLKRPSPVTMIQSFTMDGNEDILSVGVETGTPNVTIRATVQVEGDNAAYSRSVHATYKGFYRIKLDNPVPVASKKTVRVTVEYEHASTGTEIIVPYEPGSKRYSLGSYKFTTHSGSGGFTLNGETISNADSCIKVYTKKDTAAGVTKVELSCASPSIPKAETISIPDARLRNKYQLTAIATPSYGVDTTIRWTSTNPAVAMVSQNGLVTVRKVGSTDIVATSVTGVSGICKLTVPEVKPESIRIESYGGAGEYTINNANAGNFTIGDTLTIWAKESPENNTEPDVTWDSSDSSVLQIIDTGYEPDHENRRYCKVKVLKNGRATLTVRSKTNYSVRTSISLIIDLVTGVSLNKSDCELTEGSGVRLVASFQPEEVRSRGLTWASSNTGVATVDSSGYVRAVKFGKATITVTTTNGGKTASCAVTVSPKDPIVAFVTRMYQICLKRQPDQGGLDDWVGKLKNHERTGAQIAHGFYFSPEMIGSGLSNWEFATRAYEGLLGRQPDAGGLADWTGRLDGGASRESIIAGFTNSVEFGALCEYYGIVRGEFPGGGGGSSVPAGAGVTGLVTRFYTTMLGRAADPIGMNGWTNEIMATPTQQKVLWVALTGFMHSDEFLAKGLSNEEFVKVLYRTFLDRECDPIGLAGWVADLQAGKSRDSIASGFAYSQEFAGIMASYGF